jgi:AcrR family transcriptional regulator
MVLTPWGDSASLRERRLPPGPATAPAEVARNQRERLFAAMIASVADHGYAATRVNDLVALSGVSTRSFYSLFADKEALMLATIDAILAEAGDLILAAAGEEPGGDPVAATVARAARLLVEHPAAARVCLVDSLGAGPQARARLAEATDRLLEPMMRVAARRFPEAPPEIPAALQGGLIALARARLLDRAEEEIPALFADFLAIFSSYEPPARPLRLAGRQPSPAPASVDGHDHAERAVRAFTALIAERGYGEASVEETLRRASMSTRTFYANFAGKEDVLLAAIESAGSQALAATTSAFRRTGEWALGIRAALGAFFNFLAFRPELASLLLVEYSAGGTEAIRLRAEVLRPLERLLDGGLRRRPTTPAIVGEVMVACVLALADRVAASSGPAALPALAPICTHLVLGPFLGSEVASGVAADDGRSRHDPELLATLEHMAAAPLPKRILLLIGQGRKSAVSLAEALGRPVAEIEAELDALEAAGYAEAVDVETDGATERHYRSRMRYIETAEWETLGEPERAAISERILDLMRTEISLATNRGSFDARLDRSLVHFRVLVDEQAWTELARIYDEATAGAMRVIAEAEERLVEERAEAIDISGALLLFEMPDLD